MYGESRRCKSKLSFNGCEKSAQKKWHYSRILMRRRRSGYATMAFELAIVAYIFSCVSATTTELAVFGGTKYMRTIVYV